MENYSRRHVVKASLWMFGALCLGLPEIVAAATEPKNASDSLLNWDKFVHNLEQRAHEQYGFVWNQDSYVSSVAHLLRNLNLFDKKLRAAMAAYPNHNHGMPEFAELLKTKDIQISLITFEKNEWLPHHDHPSMTGVLTCAKGDLQVTSYDRLQPSYSDASSPTLLKELGSEVISPGKISTLTNTRRNVHTVRAVSFTQVIDIFTPPYNDERTTRTTWYKLERQPVKGQANVFVAYPY